MQRRSYILAAGCALSTAVGGCLSIENEENSSSDSTKSNDTDKEGGSGPVEASSSGAGTSGSTKPVGAVWEYIQAGTEANVDATKEVVHKDSPLMSFLEEGETNFQEDELEEVEIVDDEVVEEDVSAGDILNLRHAETLFQNEYKLANTLDDEDAVILDVSFAPTTAVREDKWVIVTENNEWKVFWAAAENPDEPKEQFMEEKIDKDEDVVSEVDWNPDVDDPGEWARVQLTEDPGIEADMVRIESTIADAEFSFRADSETGWAGSWANVNLNPASDQIVVTAISEKEATVVHRVHYDP